MSRTVAVLLLLCLSSLPPLATQAGQTNVYYVAAAGASAQPPYGSWESASTNIQAAVDLASAAFVPGATECVVLVSNGTYQVAVQVSVTNAITLRGASGSAADVVIRGAYPARTNRCLYVTGGAVVEGFTITNGAADLQQPLGNHGAGIYLSGGAVRNCLVTGNRLVGGSGKGAGLLMEGASSFVSNCVLANNRGLTSANGAGAYVGGGLMVDCIVSGNDAASTSPSVGGLYVIGARAARCFVGGNAGRVGGVYIETGGFLADSIISNNTSTLNTQAGLTMTSSGIASNCLIVANRSTSNGGGGGGGPAISFSSGGTAHSCVIRGNSARSGVIMMNNGTLMNCLVEGNSVAESNVVMMTDNGVIENCTIAQNQAGLSCGGFYGSPPDIVVRNTIVYGNDAPVKANWAVANTSTPVMEFNCTDTAFPGLSNLVANPQFMATGSGYGTNAVLGDHRPAPGSPCVNAGKNVSWMTRGLDLDGNPRIRPLSTGRVDIGCYEAAALSGPLLVELSAFPESGPAPLSVVLTPLVDGATNGLGCRWTLDSDVSGWMAPVKLTNVFAAGFHTVVLAVTNAAGESASRTNVNFIKSSPAVLYVATNGLHQSPYDSWTQAATNLQTAVDLAGPGSTIWVGDGVYTVQAPVTIPYAVSLRSFSGNPARAVIRGAYPASTNRCLTISGPGAVVDGFTITNGNAWLSYGGGVYMTAASTVQNCVIAGNTTVSTSAGIGGGLAATAGSVLNCEIRNNSSTASGGGGGVFANGAGVVVRNCLVAGNRATYHGGGIRLDAGLVDACVVSGNESLTGGGGVSKASTATAVIRNCLISGNQTATLGGGVYMTSGKVILENGTLAGNGATNGGGLYATLATLYGTNCIVSGNRASQAGGTNDIAGVPVSFAYSCSPLLSAGAGGNSAADPQFARPGAGDYRLKDGSPCRDTGVALPWMAAGTDLAGEPRIQGGGPNMGAYETVVRRSGVLFLIR